jgi:hypothetical protein
VDVVFKLVLMAGSIAAVVALWPLERRERMLDRTVAKRTELGLKSDVRGGRLALLLGVPFLAAMAGLIAYDLVTRLLR